MNAFSRFRGTAPSACAPIVAALAAVFCLTAVGSTAHAQDGKDPFGGKFNHYQCYDIVDWSTRPEGAFSLDDQFQRDKAKIVRPLFLCNPVDKNGEGIPAKAVHLICYEMQPGNPSGDVYRTEVNNQVEKNSYYVRNPHIMCVPSEKRHIR